MKKIIFILLMVPLLYAQFDNINALAQERNATISWDTAYNCSSKVLYGTTEGLGKIASSSSKSLHHTISLTSLKPNTKYFYRLQCTYNNTVYNSSIETFTTLQAYPDVSIMRMTITPSTVTVGDNITVKVYAKNIGSEKASNLSISLICADGSVRKKGNLSLSTNQQTSVSFDCPSPTGAGNFSIIAIADQENRISEKDENNNNNSISVYYSAKPQPDLSISESDITYQIKEINNEQMISLKMYVKNIGTEKAPSVFVCANEKCARISMIPANSRAYTSINLPINQTTIRIMVDSNNTVSELNENNNEIIIHISQEAMMPDLFISDSSLSHSPALPKTGSTVSIKAKVENRGAAAAKNVKVVFQKVERIDFYEERDSEKGGEVEYTELSVSSAKSGFEIIKKANNENRQGIIQGPILGEVVIPSIQPNSSKDVQIAFKIPSETNKMVIAVRVDPENEIKERNEYNNIGVHKLEIEELYPDLKINSSDISFSPSNIAAGGSARTKVKIKNDGTAAAQNVTVEFYMAAEEDKFELLETKTIEKIPAKGYKEVSFDWSAPNRKYVNVLINIDPKGAIRESDEKNNIANKSADIDAPDLRVDSVNYTGTVSIGSTITLKATVSNIGTAKASNAQLVFYYVDKNGEENEIGEKTITLSAGEKTTQTIQWTVPSGISANPIIVAKVNPSNYVYESDFSNNAFSLSLNASLPDIVLSINSNRQAIVIPSASGYYSYAQVTTTAYNSGTARANNIVIRVFADGKKIDEQTIQQLNPMESKSIITYTRINNTYDVGDIIFSAVADPSNTVTESLENNNEAEIAVPLVSNQPPNAVISADKTTGLRGEWFTFNCRNTTDPNGPYYTCRWKFDNENNWEDGTEVYRSFTTSGQHIVVLNVTDNYGASDSDYYIITVKGNQPPIAVLEQSYTAYKGEPITFSPFASMDPDGGITSVYWNFGDGNAQTTGFDTVSYTYANTGSYILTMRVTDSDGAISTATALVNVVNPPETKTKTGTEYYISHVYNSPWAAGPQATVYYGVYRVDYKIKYTKDDNVIRYLEYTIYSGPAIVTQVTDNDAESLYMDMTATAANGYVAMQVNKVQIMNDNTVVWSSSGGPEVSGTQSPRTMSYSDLDVPMSGNHNYVVINLDVTYPANMCAAEQFDCQHQVAFWKIN